MTGGTFTMRIQSPPPTVWGLVADLGTHASWSPKPYTIEWLSGEPNQVGSRFRSVGWVPGDKHHVNEGEITERVEPTRFALKSDDGGWFLNEFDLIPVGDGATEVRFTLTFPKKLKGFAGVAAPVVFPLVGRPDIHKRLDLLKEKAERG